MLVIINGREGLKPLDANIQQRETGTADSRTEEISTCPSGHQNSLSVFALPLQNGFRSGYGSHPNCLPDYSSSLPPERLMLLSDYLTCFVPHFLQPPFDFSLQRSEDILFFEVKYKMRPRVLWQKAPGFAVESFFDKRNSFPQCIWRKTASLEALEPFPSICCLRQLCNSSQRKGWPFLSFFLSAQHSLFLGKT